MCLQRDEESSGATLAHYESGCVNKFQFERLNVYRAAATSVQQQLC